MKQREFIYKYNYNHKPKFNKEFFNRKDEDLINAIKNIIYSCERDSTFTIKVNKFEVIDDYDEIKHQLWEYENSILSKNKKASDTGKNKIVNQYDYINIKDSALILIKVEYFISIVEKKNGRVSDTIETFIAIPRIVDGFYFKLNGNYFSAMYQIVDASTYNNSASKNAKTQSITFKTAFMATRFYRYKSTIKDINGIQIQCTYFVANMFRKSLLAIKYIIAKMGIIGSLKFLHLDGIYILDDSNIDRINPDENYIFPVKDRGIYVVVNKFIYDNIQIAQSYVYTLYTEINSMKDYKCAKFFDTETWIKALGSEFVQKDVNVYEKGISILESLDFIYDIETKNDLRLSEEDKSDIYRVIRWIMYEFNALRAKDNLDITTKKVRWAEYIACYYANKISLGIYRISDKADKADLTTIKKALQISPMYLINTISKSQLINYKSSVNDLDSITALKYTYKGISGIGEKANAIPNSYRNVNPSHLGRIDIDSSSNSDPGTSGGLVPLVKLYDGHFSEYEEPSTWESSLSKVIDAYNSMVSKVDMIRLIDSTNMSTKPSSSTEVINDCISINKRLLQIPMIVERDSEYINGIDIFGDGIMFYHN